jgi:transposase-like protein
MVDEIERVPDVIALIADWGLTNAAFRRNRLAVRRKVLAAVLAASGVSYRETAALLSGMSYVAVRDCYMSLTSILPRGEKVHRRTVALDESVVRLGSGQAYLWLARDVDTGQTLSFMCSFTGSPEDSATFARSVLETCSNKPTMRLGQGPNRPRALKNLDFYFQTEGTSGVVQIFQRIFGVVSR